jgi:hypothetical protein
MPNTSSGDKAVSKDSFNDVYYFVIQPSCSAHLQLPYIHGRRLFHFLCHSAPCRGDKGHTQYLKRVKYQV